MVCRNPGDECRHRKSEICHHNDVVRDYAEHSGFIKCLFLFVATVAASLVYGQNATTAQGLKVGKWTIKRDGVSETGVYKIIPLNKYATVEDEGERRRDILFKNRKVAQYYPGGRYDTLISVEDGLWTYREDFGPYKETFLVDGVEIWQKRYNEKGELFYYTTEDHATGTRYTTRYDSGRTTDSTVESHPNGEYPGQTFYYPGGSLMFKDIQGWLYANFLHKATDTTEFKFVPKESFSVTQLLATSKTLSFYDKNFRSIKTPLRLTKNDTFDLKVVYRPTRLDSRRDDTIFLTTDMAGDRPYKLYLETDASHIAWSTPDTTFTLSKHKDRHLIVNALGGSVHTVYISDKKETIYEEVVGKKLIVPLAKFRPGEYKIEILGDGPHAYNFTLHIVE